MKFDMNAAWNEAMRLANANRDVLLVVAGVFFFLPYVAFMLLFRDRMNALEAAQAARPDPEAASAAMMGFYGDIWWVILLIAVIQGIGMVGLLALLRDRSRPTVGEALKTGVRYLLPYLGAQLITSFVMGMLLLLPFLVAGVAGVTIGVFAGGAAIVGIAYTFVRFMLTPPVIAVEKVGNPIAAMGRSWRLTKGNAVRLFFFTVLLVIALLVVSIVFSIVVGLVFALGGTQSALIGQAIVSGLVNAIFVTIFLAVLAAIHRQLAGPTAAAIGETFD